MTKKFIQTTIKINQDAFGIIQQRLRFVQKTSIANQDTFAIGQ